MDSLPPAVTPPDAPLPDPVPEQVGLSGRSWAIVAVVVLAVLAFVAYSILQASGTDETLELEASVREVLDESYERSSVPTWCNPVCSDSDDEWHTAETAGTVAEDLVAALIAAGFEADFSQGGPDAYLVLISDGNGLDIGVTGPEWPRSSSNSAGTAIWFTSVEVFDQATTDA